MRFVSFRRNGISSYGAVEGDSVMDLGARLGSVGYLTLRLLLERNGLPAARQVSAKFVEDFTLYDIEYAPVIPDPRKILCAGNNYHKVHPVEGRVVQSEYPPFFPKVLDAFVAHEQSIFKPTVSEFMDYEGELALVIGTAGRNIPPSDVWSYIAGYTCMNDGTVRDWLKRGPGPGKNFFRSGSYGPFLVTADEVPNPGSLRLVTRVNGRVVQDGNTNQMIFDIAAIVSYLSEVTWLWPGDIISTGTPDGSAAAHSPPRYLSSGDVIEIELERVGTLRNKVIDDNGLAKYSRSD